MSQTTLLETLKPLLGFLVVTLFLVANGADDIEEKIRNRPDRKPVGNEALLRIGYVVAKMLTGIYGGCLLAPLATSLIMNWATDEQRASLSESLRLWMTPWLVIAIIAAYSLVGALQNLIRVAQGRPAKRFLTMTAMRNSLSQWRPRP